MEKNNYTVGEAAKLKSRTPQFIGPKNWSYDIPKMAFDNHLRGANALDIENIKEAVKIAFKEVLSEMVEKEVERRLAN